MGNEPSSLYMTFLKYIFYVFNNSFMSENIHIPVSNSWIYLLTYSCSMYRMLSLHVSEMSELEKSILLIDSDKKSFVIKRFAYSEKLFGITRMSV